jgi:hypothetical protein
MGCRGILVAVAFVALSFPACAADEAAPAAPLPPAWRSGGRLKARSWTLGGASVPAAIHDSLLGIDCEFDHPPAGSPAHCLPVPAYDEQFALFADPGCSQRVFQAYGDPRPLVAVDPLDACTSERRAFRLGQRLACPTIRYRLTAEGCVPDGDSCALYSGKEVPLDTFVAGEREILDLGGPVGAVAVNGDDGSRWIERGHDARRDEPVSSEPIGAAGTFWVADLQLAYDFGGAESTHGGAIFVDPSCSEVGALKLSHNAVCPIRTIQAFSGITCEHTGLYDAGETLPGRDFYATSEDGACTPYVADDSLVVRRGAEIPLDALVPVTFHLEGDGPVRARYAGSGGRPIVASGLYVIEWGTTCVVEKRDDEVLRCYPGWDTVAGGTSFADAACEDRVAVRRTTKTASCPGRPPPAPPPPSLFATRPDGYAKIGRRLPETGFYEVVEGACVPENPPENATWQHFVIGEPVPAGAFPAVVESID